MKTACISLQTQPTVVRPFLVNRIREVSLPLTNIVRNSLTEVNQFPNL